MKTRMEELVSSWVNYARQKKALLEQITELVRETDNRFESKEEQRDLQLKELKRQFYRVVLAERLSEREQSREDSPEELLATADEMLAKRVHVARYSPAADMRTADEERMYGSLRVTWHNLLKKAKVRAADNRGGPSNPYGRAGRYG